MNIDKSDVRYYLHGMVNFIEETVRKRKEPFSNRHPSTMGKVPKNLPIDIAGLKRRDGSFWSKYTMYPTKSCAIRQVEMRYILINRASMKVETIKSILVVFGGRDAPYSPKRIICDYHNDEFHWNWSVYPRYEPEHLDTLHERPNINMWSSMKNIFEDVPSIELAFQGDLFRGLKDV